MFVNTFTRRIVFNAFFLAILSFIYFSFFYDIYISDEIIISFAVHPFNICERFPDVWFLIKIAYIPVSFISSLICINILYSSFFTRKQIIKSSPISKTSDLYLKIYNETDKNLFIPESGLYQNFLITGTIGSGKTSSVMYPFTRQLIEYNFDNHSKKLGMLILDVKGNYYNMVKKYATFYKRENDLIIIELRSVKSSTIPLINLI